MMNAPAQQILIAFLGICSPFLLLFLIVGILAPRYKDFSERKGWTVQPHPEDHRDYVFRGQEESVSWEMEYYVYEHYRNLGPKNVPFTNVIVWTSNSIKLPAHTLLIYPRSDRLKHFVHPRLSLKRDAAPVADLETEKLEGFLLRLPQKTIGSGELQESFVICTDLDAVPDNLINQLQVELLSWPKIQMAGPVILMNSKGIVIWWIPTGMRNEWLEKTVRLGMSLTSSL